MALNSMQKIEIDIMDNLFCKAVLYLTAVCFCTSCSLKKTASITIVKIHFPSENIVFVGKKNKLDLEVSGTFQDDLRLLSNNGIVYFENGFFWLVPDREGNAEISIFIGEQLVTVEKLNSVMHYMLVPTIQLDTLGHYLLFGSGEIHKRALHGIIGLSSFVDNTCIKGDLSIVSFEMIVEYPDSTCSEPFCSLDGKFTLLQKQTLIDAPLSSRIFFSRIKVFDGNNYRFLNPFNLRIIK